MDDNTERCVNCMAGQGRNCACRPIDGDVLRVLAMLLWPVAVALLIALGVWAWRVWA